MYELKDYQNSADYILRSGFKPEIGLILGSGLGKMTAELENASVIKYEDIPNFPASGIEGHEGALYLGRLRGRRLAILSGRFHCYEGYSMEQTVFPVRALKLAGVETLIVTNSAGAVNEKFKPGDLMLIKDHIKMVFESPLMGKNIDAFGPRFNDMGDAYTLALREKAKEAAYSLELPLRSGVYAYMSGPSFETPAEISALRTLGADAVGMSTVPEVIAAAHAGMRVMGISCITNMAAGILDEPLSHEKVIETGASVREKLAAFIREVIAKL